MAVMEDLRDDAIKARSMGMSYGQYIALQKRPQMYTCGECKHYGAGECRCVNSNYYCDLRRPERISCKKFEHGHKKKTFCEGHPYEKQGKRLYDIRTRKHKTIPEVSKICGVAQGILSKTESGITKPKPETIEKMTIFYGDEIRSMFNGI